MKSISNFSDRLLMPSVDKVVSGNNDELLKIDDELVLWHGLKIKYLTDLP